MIQGALSNFASEQNEKFMKTKNSNKKLTLRIGALLINFSAHAINIVKSSSRLESAYAEWQYVDNAKRYNVYYEQDGGKKVKIDNIRVQNTYLHVLRENHLCSSAESCGRLIL